MKTKQEILDKHILLGGRSVPTISIRNCSLSAMEEYAEQKCNLLRETLLNPTKQDKVYVTYDKDDGDIYCAYLDEEKCKKDALDSGCGVKTLNLY